MLTGGLTGGLKGALAAALAAALLLPGCGTTPSVPAAPTAGAPATATKPAPRASGSLVVERRWLQSWFKDTPVRIAQRGNGDVSVEVPLKYCFVRGRSAVLPPLAAVLDKVAESLRRVPQSQLQLIAAPGGLKVDRDLAAQRAAALRDQLLSRGVADAQLGEPAVADGMAVQLRLTLAAP